MKNDLILIVTLVLMFLPLNVFSQYQYHYVPGCAIPVAINDSLYVNRPSSRHALDMLDARCAWTITKGNSNIIVGVVDTEFKTTHEDLVGTFAGISGPQIDTRYHGTSVSSNVATGTNNNIGIAGIGYNTRVRGYHVNSSTVWGGISRAYDIDGIKIRLFRLYGGRAHV